MSNVSKEKYKCPECESEAIRFKFMNFLNVHFNQRSILLLTFETSIKINFMANISIFSK